MRYSTVVAIGVARKDRRQTITVAIAITAVTTTAAADTDATNAAVGAEADASAAIGTEEDDCNKAVDEALSIAAEGIGTHEGEPVAEAANG
jgi:hypothetical protein